MRLIVALILLLLPLSAQAASIPLSRAVFAGGNFWAMQYVFDDLPGVDHTLAGYTGGILANPSYLQVAKGKSGHRLAVMVFYNPKKISYEQLLQVFWHNIDPLDGQGQFCDRGPQFTTAIYYGSEAERLAAAQSKELVEADSARMGDKSAATLIIPAAPFYPAEDYHQEYYEKNFLRFEFYTNRCKRDQRLYELWGNPNP